MIRMTEIIQNEGAVTEAERLAFAGRRLCEVIALAEALPYRPSETLKFPRLPTTTQEAPHE
jgi:hypothetical protein